MYSFKVMNYLLGTHNVEPSLEYLKTDSKILEQYKILLAFEGKLPQKLQEADLKLSQTIDDMDKLKKALRELNMINMDEGAICKSLIGIVNMDAMVHFKQWRKLMVAQTRLPLTKVALEGLYLSLTGNDIRSIVANGMKLIIGIGIFRLLQPDQS